jgi:hypothetical protein
LSRPATIAAVGRLLVAVAAALALIACTNPSGSAPTADTTTPAPPPANVPGDVPPSYEDAVAADNVPAAALIPTGATVSDSWTTPAGDAIAVAWEYPSADPFRQDRGVAVWHRYDDGSAPWRPVWAAEFSPKHENPVLGVDARFADVTGDGSTDALIFASVGGSGGCGTTFVVDIAAAAQVYRSRGCDRAIDPSSDPVGLRIREAVYAPGDPHCCPSSFRESVLVYEGGAWRTATSSVSPV